VPEKNTTTEALRAAAPIHVGNVTLLPIERVVIRSDTFAARAWFAICKQPHALVIRDAAGIRVIDIDDKPVDIEQLRKTIPNLDGLLASM